MRIDFETHPSRYRHWALRVDDAVATLAMDVDASGALDPDGDYELKLNSYDLGVDIELADALQRIRFEHPEVRALVVRSGRDDVFCSGANIYMLRDTSHGLKVNFCKFTNETRLYLEELSAESHDPEHRCARAARPREGATSSPWPATRSSSWTTATAR